METMTTTHGCDLTADAPKVYVLLPTGLPRSTGGVRLRPADVTVGGVAGTPGNVDGIRGDVDGIATGLATPFVLGFAARSATSPTAPTTAPPGPQLTT